MGFDDDPIKSCELGGDLLIVAFGHRTRIEEIPRVVQLHLADRLALFPERQPCGCDLRGNRARRRVGRRRVLPEIAHHAAPRTLAAGEKNGRDPHRGSLVGPLVFDNQILIAPRVATRSRTATLQDEPVACGGSRRIHNLFIRLTAQSSLLSRGLPATEMALAPAAPDGARLIPPDQQKLDRILRITR